MARFRAGINGQSVQGSPGIPAPGDGLFLEKLGEKVDLLFEQFVIVVEVVPEQREGFGA
jgi:hypothetical protein